MTGKNKDPFIGNPLGVDLSPAAIEEYKKQQAAARAQKNAQIANIPTNPLATTQTSQKAASNPSELLQQGIQIRNSLDYRAKEAARANQAKEANATTPTPTMPQSNAVTNYETLMGRLEDQDFYRTPSQLAAEKKRERARRIITSVGDGISAISNLISTANYGANAYDGKSTLTGKVKENYDKLIKDREAQKQAYVNGWLGAADKDLANGWRAYLQSYQEGRDKVGDERDTRNYLYKIGYNEAEAKRKQDNEDRDYELNVDKHNENVRHHKEMEKKKSGDTNFNFGRGSANGGADWVVYTRGADGVVSPSYIPLTKQEATSIGNFLSSHINNLSKEGKSVIEKELKNRGIQPQKDGSYDGIKLLNSGVFFNDKTLYKALEDKVKEVVEDPTEQNRILETLQLTETSFDDDDGSWFKPKTPKGSYSNNPVRTTGGLNPDKRNTQTTVIM